MSYCRWSDEDFRSDVYCYRSDEGWETWVATHRHVPPEPMPQPLTRDATAEEWFARHSAVMSLIDRAELVPICGPYDGEHFNDCSASDTLETLLMLRRAGYSVPDHALQELRDEAA